jgi:hypothetical protein
MFDLPLDIVVVYRDISVVEVSDQLLPLADGIPECFTQRAIGGSARQQLIHPYFEALQDVLGFLLAQRDHRLRRQRLPALLVLFGKRLDLTLDLM